MRDGVERRLTRASSGSSVSVAEPPGRIQLRTMPVATATPARMKPQPINMVAVAASSRKSQPHTIPNSGMRYVTAIALVGPALASRRKYST